MDKTIIASKIIWTGDMLNCPSCGNPIIRINESIGLIHIPLIHYRCACGADGVVEQVFSQNPDGVSLDLNPREKLN